MTPRRRPRPGATSADRPLTPAEQEAVERQGAYLAWVRATHPDPGPGLFTSGVCGGSPLTGKDEETTPLPKRSQDESDRAPHAITEREHHREWEEAERHTAQNTAT